MEVYPIRIRGRFPVFARHCTACDRRQLIFSTQITGLKNTEHGIEVNYTCWCGEPQMLLTGKKAAALNERLHAVAVAA